MMLLLRAELTKLRRPLTWWVAGGAVVISLLFAWQGLSNATAGARDDAHPSPPRCEQIFLTPGPACDEAVANFERLAQQKLAQNGAGTRHNANPNDGLTMEHPLGSGKLAIGVMASLPGAILILLLAAGHVGNEWNGRTIKAVLTQEGHRSRLLAAKAVTLWVAALGIVLVDWAALAGFSFVLKAAYHLPGGSIPWPAAWSAVADDAARAPLVLAVFVIIGVAAAVLVRNTLGGFLLAGGAVIASMVAAGFSGISRLTLAYWVSGWMQFQPRAYVVYHFWSDRYPSGVSPPGQLRGLLGLAAVIVVGATLAVTTLKRVDIST